MLQDFLNESASRYVAPEILATVYASLGEREQAFTWLDKAYQIHSGGPMANSILRFPEFDSMRSDPRFAALVKKVGLEQ